jgi:hypothetical protein
MLKPMQRVTKYPLLVKGVFKNTEPGHPDHENMKKAADLIETVVTYINVICGKVEERHKMIKLLQEEVKKELSSVT